MPPRKSRWKRRIATAMLVVVTAVVIGGIALQNYATPLQRTHIQHPLFTVGDTNYAAALNDGKNIVKFGRLPLGIYPGGLAFDDPQDAWEFLRRIEKDREWSVYRLSGDFELDTTLVDDQRYTAVSLLVLGGVTDKPID